MQQQQQKNNINSRHYFALFFVFRDAINVMNKRRVWIFRGHASWIDSSLDNPTRRQNQYYFLLNHNHDKLHWNFQLFFFFRLSLGISKDYGKKFIFLINCVILIFLLMVIKTLLSQNWFRQWWSNNLFFVYEPRCDDIN